MADELFKAARGLARRGLAVFPCGVESKTPAPILNLIDARPGKGGLHHATTDTGTVRDWWESDPAHNIGVRTGAASGLFVIDVDGEDGEQAMRKLEAEHGALPPTIEVLTPRGRHMWFSYTEPVGCSASKIGTGIDIRCDNGYVIAPPSIHPDTKTAYQWSVDSAEKMVAAPAWVYERLRVQKKATTGPALGWEPKIREGERNARLCSVIGWLLWRVEADRALYLADAINRANCEPPMSDAELIATFKSILAKHERRQQ